MIFPRDARRKQRIQCHATQTECSRVRSFAGAVLCFHDLHREVGSPACQIEKALPSPHKSPYQNSARVLKPDAVFVKKMKGRVSHMKVVSLLPFSAASPLSLMR